MMAEACYARNGLLKKISNNNKKCGNKNLIEIQYEAGNKYDNNDVTPFARPKDSVCVPESYPNNGTCMTQTEIQQNYGNNKAKLGEIIEFNKVMNSKKLHFLDVYIHVEIMQQEQQNHAPMFLIK